MAAARWAERWQVAVAAWQWQRSVGGGSSAAVAVTARRQHGGSTAAAAWRWRRQLGNGGSAAEAAVGDGRDEGGEVVTWNLFMFVISLHL